MDNKLHTNLVSKISASQIIPENIHLLIRRDSNKSVKSLEIDPTDVCGHECYFCFTKDNRTKNSISPQCLKIIVDNFINDGGLSIHFSGGGDPLKYKFLYISTDIFENKNVIDYLLDKGIAIGIITNGYDLNKLPVATIQRLAFIRISLDSINPIVYSRIHNCPVKNHDKIIENIKKIESIRKNRNYPAIGISFVVDPSICLNTDKSDIEAISLMAQNLNVDFVQLKHIHSTNEMIAEENMRNVHEYSCATDWGAVEFWVHHYIAPNPQKQCRITQYIKVVASMGTYPCCHLFGKKEFISENFSIVGKTTFNCTSHVCRYNSMNVLLQENTNNIGEHLKKSIDKYGYHPYRLFPSAPDIFSPFKTKNP